MNKKFLGGCLPVLFGLFLVFSTFTAATPTGTNLQLVLIKSEPVSLQAGTYADIWLKILNNGTVTARNVELHFNDNFPFYVVSGEKRVWDFGKIIAGDEVQVKTRIAVNDTALEGDNELRFLLKINGFSIVKKISVDIGEDSPALLITRVSTEPNYIAPGSEAKIIIELKNGGYKYLRDIDVNLSFSSNIPLLPIGSSSVKRINEIAPQETTKIGFDVKATESATSQTYGVPINLKFFDSAGTQHEKTEITGIKIGGTPKLVFHIENTVVLKSKQTNTIQLSVVNKDMIDAKFVNLEFVTTDGYKIVSPTSVYLGNIDSDDYQTTDVEIYCEKSGITKLTVNLEYSSPDGIGFVETKTVPLKVYTKKEISTLGLEQRNNNWIGGLVVILAIGSYFGYRKYKKKKQNKK